MRVSAGQHLTPTFRGFLDLSRLQLIVQEHVGDIAARVRFRMGFQDWNCLRSFTICVQRLRFQKQSGGVRGIDLHGALNKFFGLIVLAPIE